MANEYISVITLDINGASFTDFSSFTEGEIETRRQVKLMNKTGSCAVTPRYTGKIDYVIPADAAEYDFAGLKDGTLTIDFENGRRRTYSGVFVMKVGEAKYDGEKEATKTIEFGAQKRSDM